MGLLLLGACPMDDDDDADSANDEGVDDDDDEGGGSSEDSTTGAGAHTISGVVKRTSALARGEDGIGTLYLGVFAECDHAAPIVGLFVMPNADMSADGAEVPFTIESLTLETVYLASFLDDDLNADQAGPLPDVGDPVLADDVEDGLLTCVTVDVATGTDIVVELNALED